MMQQRNRRRPAPLSDEEFVRRLYAAGELIDEEMMQAGNMRRVRQPLSDADFERQMRAEEAGRLQGGTAFAARRRNRALDGGTLYAAAANVRTDGQPAARQENTPLGIRNNNPGNVRPLGGNDQWQGQTGIHRQGAGDRGFAVFDTPENGLRAMGVNIVSQQALHGRNTVSDIIGVWAPPTDDNPTNAYASRVANDLGVGVNERIDTQNPAILRGLMNAIIHHENSNQNPYTDEQIANGANTAITHHNRRRR